MTTKNQLIQDILDDAGLVQQTVKIFVDAANAMVKNANVSKDYKSWTMDALLHAAGIEKVWTKESAMSVALWVLFFAITGEHYPAAQLKYQNMQAFLDAYEGHFNDTDPAEQETLKNEANWFNVVSTLLPPRMSKGLTIQVVPRLVEGWQAKYVTGSGQTETTRRRVYIFEREGGVAPLVREGRSKTRTKTEKRTVKSSKKTKPSSRKTRSSSRKSTFDNVANCVFYDVDGQTLTGEAALMIACQWSKYELMEGTRATDRFYKKHKEKEMERKLQQTQQHEMAVMALQKISRSGHNGNSSGHNGNGVDTKAVITKTPQRMATERLFQPASHQNSAELTSLCDELGLDSNDIVSAAAMLLCVDPSYLQRLAACLKVGPQCLFQKAFLPNIPLSPP